MCPMMAVFDLSIGLLQADMSIIEDELLREEAVIRVILWRCLTCQFGLLSLKDERGEGR